MASDVNTTVGEDRIGNYRFVRTLHPGQNSMVMEVVQEGSGRRLVAKQLLPSAAADAASRRAFEFEAKLGMDLSHPNLIRVFEYNKDRHGPYFVMEYFPSVHLRMCIAKKEYALSPARIRRVIEQTAAALAYMHDKGWVHRDVKPENILVNKSGEVRLIDYALAMRPFGGLRKLFQKKVAGQGTYSYMSPEQILRKPPTFAADIYSFGITCYELACGRQPFRANSPSELFQKHLREQPVPPVVYNKAITPEFSDLVLSMIKKKPEDRPASLQEFLSRFRRVRIYQDDPDPQAETAGF